MAHLTTNNWTIRLGALAVMIALLTVVMTVTAQADGPEWKLPVTGLTVSSGRDDQAGANWTSPGTPTPRPPRHSSDYRVTWTPNGQGLQEQRPDRLVHAYPTGTQRGNGYRLRRRREPTRSRVRDPVRRPTESLRWSEVANGQAAAPTAPTNSAATGQPAVTGTARGRADTHRGNLRHLRPTTGLTKRARSATSGCAAPTAPITTSQTPPLRPTRSPTPI